jgi:hypothetical protein
MLIRLIGRSQVPAKRSHRDILSIAGDQLTLQRAGKSPVSLCAGDVAAIWYDYNPFGWQHANSLRIVYAQHDRATSIDVYDEQHTYELLLGWLQQHFPAQVASRYRALWGSPGGDDPSIHLWGADAHGA